MKVLVTGGAGYIGSHACKALARSGHALVVYDNLSTGHPEAVRWGPLVIGDIRDGARLSALLRDERPDLVLHFASLAYVGDSVRDPAAYFDVNVSGSLSLLNAMRSSGVDKIIFSSSCATYGIPSELPISETTLQAPVNPYGFTKLVVERALLDFGHAYGLQWMALRYFNAAGADPEGELGEDHDPETHIIPLSIRAALGSGPPFAIFGSDYATPDGSAVRDYIHVSDLAEAHVLACERLAAGGSSAAMNLGTGLPTSVLEIIAAVEKVTGRPVPAVIGARRPGDPPILFADPSLARRELGWTPKYMAIEDIVLTAANWFRRSSVDLAA